MTFKEKYKTFTAYQNAMAQKALEYNKEHLNILENAIQFKNDYAVKTNKGHNEIVQEAESMKSAISYLEKLIESEGKIVNPIYKAYWNNIQNTEV